MKHIVIAAAMTLSVTVLAPLASADTLILRDGSRLQGTVVGFAERTLTFRQGDGVPRRYSTSDIDAVEFSPAERPAGRGLSRLLEAPAGTELVVRTVDAIDSRNARPDQQFAAIVEYDVTTPSGRVVIPERSGALLVIRDLSSGGATGSPEMVLDIESITVEGRRYLISTMDLALESKTGIGRNSRTAETVGGGAVLGTIIGAIAGGGKGAAIGGLVGAAGGAGAQVLTRGRDVHVPAETVLTFTLDRPMALQPDR